MVWFIFIFYGVDDLSFLSGKDKILVVLFMIVKSEFVNFLDFDY